MAVEAGLTPRYRALPAGWQAVLVVFSAAGLLLAINQLFNLNFFAGYVLLENRYLYLVESGTRRGWGIYVVDTRATSSLLVEVPRPIEEWATLECGAHLFQVFGGRSLAISTAMSGGICKSPIW